MAIELYKLARKKGRKRTGIKRKGRAKKINASAAIFYPIPVTCEVGGEKGHFSLLKI